MKTNQLLMLVTLVVLQFACVRNAEVKSVSSPNDTIVTKVEEKQDTTPQETDFTLAPSNKVADLSTSNGDEIEHFYQQNQKPSQTFTVSSTQTKTIICKEGTKITIDANSFETQSGKAVTGDVTIQVKEFYTIADILMANLSTTSNNQLLETGGMIYVEAFANGEKCVLKKEATIELQFPTTQKKEDMQLFYGEWNKNRVNWTVAETSSKVVETESKGPYTFVDKPASFQGGNLESFRQWVSQNLKYPAIAAENGISGKVYVQFVVNKQGKVVNVTVVRPMDPALDKESIRVVKNSPDWAPPMNKGQLVEQVFTIPISYVLNGVTPSKISKDDQFEKNVEEVIAKQNLNVERNDTIKNESYIPDLNYYIFNSSKLGWLNCDRFQLYQNKIDNYLVLTKSCDEYDVSFVFKKYKSFLKGNLVKGGVGLSNAPLGERVTIVAIKFENNQHYIAVQETVISATAPELTFKPVTVEQLKEAIKAIQ